MLSEIFRSIFVYNWYRQSMRNVENIYSSTQPSLSGSKFNWGLCSEHRTAGQRWTLDKVQKKDLKRTMGLKIEPISIPSSSQDTVQARMSGQQGQKSNLRPDSQRLQLKLETHGLCHGSQISLSKYFQCRCALLCQRKILQLANLCF